MNSLSCGKPGRPSSKRITSEASYINSPKFNDRICIILIVSADKIEQGLPGNPGPHAEYRVLRGLLPYQIGDGLGHVSVLDRGNVRNDLEPLVIRRLLAALHRAQIDADR